MFRFKERRWLGLGARRFAAARGAFRHALVEPEVDLAEEALRRFAAKTGGDGTESLRRQRIEAAQPLRRPGATGEIGARFAAQIADSLDGYWRLFRAKGVDRIICVSVNDPFVMGAWRTATGADKAGLTFLSDADGSFTQAMGMGFDAPPAGLFGRSKRYAMLIEDGTITALNLEESPGQCDISGGEALLARA